MRRLALSLSLALLTASFAAACAPTQLDAERCDTPDPSSDLATAQSALSSVSCGARRDVGYRAGSAFDITVVTVDGRPVERDTANAYIVMAARAARAGVEIRIVSGFRTMAEQRHLYHCYTSCSCNGCNLAARPGYSNHQSGHALDLNTSAPGVLGWLNAHGAEFGFRRTVPSEPWHWEWWGGGPGGGPCGARCTPHCSGTRVVEADCSEGDCAAYGASCAETLAGVRCVARSCTPHCSGTRVVGADCREGDCAVYGATCAETLAGVRCVAPPAPAPPVAPSASCGHNGEYCCPGRSCTDGSFCNDTFVGPVCQCGHNGQYCCPGRSCTDGSFCNDTFVGPVCQCGHSGQFCCPGRACLDRSSCTATGFGPVCR